MLSREAMLEALRSKNIGLDGHFVVGITSTGIYCRPICRARQAKDDHCNFFSTAAEAEKAGFRPCLLCKPEGAPGVSAEEGSFDLAYRASRFIEDNCEKTLNISSMAERWGADPEELQHHFESRFRVSPLQYQETCRLLLAKNLLSRTLLPLADIAEASGFTHGDELREKFNKNYRLCLDALRPKKKAEDEIIHLLLGYRPPYSWEAMIDFLSGRCIKGVEHVENNQYRRTVRLGKENGQSFSGWICVAHEPQKNALSLKLSRSLLPVIGQVIARVKHLFDLRSDPAVISHVLERMNQFRPDVFKEGIRVPGSFDAFEMATRAVLGQQITVKAAGTLARRIVEKFGTPIDTGIPGLTHLFPTPEEILDLGEDIEEQLGRLGVVAARSRTIAALAYVSHSGEICLSPSARPEKEIKKLMEIRGIGDWTAQYIAMRTMEWHDAFLQTDAGIKKAMAPLSSKEMVEIAQDWRPWRSYATLSLWNSLTQLKVLKNQ